MRELSRVCRRLAASPSFTVVAVLSLAIGTGVNVAVFGVVRELLFERLPVPAPDNLFHVGWTQAAETPGLRSINSSSYPDPAGGASLRTNFSSRQYDSMRRAAGDGVRLSAYAFLREIAVASGEQPATLAGGVLVDGQYFATLQGPMAHGRPLTAGDDSPGARRVAVISHRLWQRLFAGDPAAIGRVLRVNGTSFEVVAITAARFRGPGRGGFFPPADVTMPLSMQPVLAPSWGVDGRPASETDGIHWLRLIARLPRTTVEATSAALTPPFVAALPGVQGSTPLPEVRLVTASRGEPLSPATVRPVRLLAGVAAAVLLMACLNLASLLLARGVARRREIAVRRAIGASRGRVIRELLLEAVVVSCVATALGVLLAVSLRAALAARLSSGLRSSAFGALQLDLPIDWTLFAAASALTALTAAACGLIPAFRACRADDGATLGQRSAASMPQLTTGRVLVAAQIGLTVPLLAASLLLLRTMHNLTTIDPGFDPRGLHFFRLNPEYAGAAGDGEPALYAEVLRRIASLPGVAGATLVENALMSGITSSSRIVAGGQEHPILMNAVGPGFFELVGMPVLAGRTPDRGDTAGRPLVAVVNQAAVDELFGGRRPIGEIVRVGARSLEIIGVVGNSRYAGPRAAVRPILFDAALQRPGFRGHHVLVKTSAGAASVERAVRDAVAELNANLPVPELRSQEAQIVEATARERVFAELFTVFGGFALLLAWIGLHGVTAYAVQRRTPEIGVRVAVGAAPRQVMALVLRQVAIVAGVGVAAGVGAALLLGPLVQSLLYEVAPNDVALITAAAAAVLAVTIAAGAVPATRAARLDPVQALQH